MEGRALQVLPSGAVLVVDLDLVMLIRSSVISALSEPAQAGTELRIAGSLEVVAAPSSVPFVTTRAHPRHAVSGASS